MKDPQLKPGYRSSGIIEMHGGSIGRPTRIADGAKVEWAEAAVPEAYAVWRDKLDKYEAKFGR